MIQAVADLYYIIVDSVLINFGWVFFLWTLAWMLYRVHILEAQKEYQNSIKWVFLEIKIHDLNERSPLAMEQVFAALHAIHQNFTWGERFDGRIVLWLSCEIVSIGGKVSYIIKIPERYRNLLESAIFAQYPKAEISETEDYLMNMPYEYYPEQVDFDFWGTQANKKKPNAYPIRNYSGFEHKEQETFIDPLANVIEVMSNIQPWELMAMQIVVRPIDDDWKEDVRPLLDKLKGVPTHGGSNAFFDAIIGIPRLFMDVLVHDLMGYEREEVRERPPKEEPPSLMLHRSDVEKLIISSIENGLSKISFEAKIRLLYLAPKDKMNKALRVPEIIGAIRNFDDVNLNGLKPDIAHSWTDPAYKISPTLEAPALRHQILVRKRNMWQYVKERKIWQATGNTILNTEELASLYHFPVAPNVRVSQVEKVQTVKSAPPADLPVG